MQREWYRTLDGAIVYLFIIGSGLLYLHAIPVAWMETYTGIVAGIQIGRVAIIPLVQWSSQKIQRGVRRRRERREQLERILTNHEPGR